jgi:hypothetical protein
VPPNSPARPHLHHIHRLQHLPPALADELSQVAQQSIDVPLCDHPGFNRSGWFELSHHVAIRTLQADDEKTQSRRPSRAGQPEFAESYAAAARRSKLLFPPFCFLRGIPTWNRS